MGLGTHILPVLLISTVMAGCATRFQPATQGPYVWTHQGLSVALPPGVWETHAAQRAGIVVFRQRGVPGGIAVQVTRILQKHLSTPSVLSRELLLDFENVTIEQTSLMCVDKDESVCRIATARLDGKDVKLRACSLVRGERIYDFTCWSTPAQFDVMNALFTQFLEGVSLGGEGKD
jgi:hypothetical protein